MSDSEEEDESLCNGNTITQHLWNAVHAQDDKEVTLILSEHLNDLETSAEGECGFSLLHLAIGFPDSERSDTVCASIVSCLVAAGWPVDATCSSTYSQTPLIMACEVGFAATANELLLHGADKDARDDLLKSPLWMAVENKDPATVEVLLEGASPGTTGPRGIPVLAAAVRWLADAVRELAECRQRMASPASDAIRDPSCLEMADGDARSLLRCLRLLASAAKAEGSIDAANGGSDCGTALHAAAEDRCTVAAEILLSAGAAVDARNARGATPLMRAVCMWEAPPMLANSRSLCVPAYCDDAEALRERREARRRETEPFFSTCERWDPAVVELFLANGASLVTRNAVGHTAVDYARENPPHRCARQSKA